MSNSIAFQRIQLVSSRLNYLERQHFVNTCYSFSALGKGKKFSVTVSSVGFEISNQTQAFMQSSKTTESRQSSISIWMETQRRRSCLATRLIPHFYSFSKKHFLSVGGVFEPRKVNTDFQILVPTTLVRFPLS